MLNTVDECERMIRKVRNHPKMWCGDARKEDQTTRLIGKLKDRAARLRRTTPKPTGRYSGLTRDELRSSGTCEPDWY